MATASSFSVLILGIVLALKCAFTATDSDGSSNTASLMLHIIGDLYDLENKDKLMEEKIESLEEKIESQETSSGGQSRDQVEEIKTLEEKLTSAVGQIKDQANKIELLEENLSSAKGQIQDQADQIKLMEEKLVSLETSFAKTSLDQAGKTENLEEGLQALDPSMKTQTSSYAFSAYNTYDKMLTFGDTIVFTKTRLNENEAYDTSTGIYTTPCDGIYQFHATLAMPYGSSKYYIFVAFKAGGTSIGAFSIDSANYDISASGSALARLQKDTKVALKVTWWRSKFKFANDEYRMPSFSGHLISK